MSIIFNIGSFASVVGLTCLFVCVPFEGISFSNLAGGGFSRPETN